MKTVMQCFLMMLLPLETSIAKEPEPEVLIKIERLDASESGKLKFDGSLSNISRRPIKLDKFDFQNALRRLKRLDPENKQTQLLDLAKIIASHIRGENRYHPEILPQKSIKFSVSIDGTIVGGPNFEKTIKYFLEWDVSTNETEKPRNKACIQGSGTLDLIPPK